MTAAFGVQLLTAPVAAAAASDKTAVFELQKGAAELGTAAEAAAADAAAMTDADAERQKDPKTGYPHC